MANALLVKLENNGLSSTSNSDSASLWALAARHINAQLSTISSKYPSDFSHTTGLHVPVDAGVAAAFLR